MKKKDVKLFSKAIHTLKTLMQDLKDERKDYHTQVDLLTKQLDTKMKKMSKEAKEALDEMYELYENLYDETGKG